MMNGALVTLTEDKTPIEIALGVDENGMTTARKLYVFLELRKSDFARWVKTNITENEFATENEDWLRFFIDAETPTGGKIQREDYKLTAHFAKKLSCKGHGEKAEMAREYFTRVEEKAKEMAIDYKSLSPELQRLYAIFESQAKMELRQKKQEEEMRQMQEKVKLLDAKVTTHDENYFTVAGYASLRGLNIDVNKANMLGRKASKLSKEYGYDVAKVKDSRYGTVNSYHVDILKEVFK